MGSELCETVRVTTGDLAVRLHAASTPDPLPLCGALRSKAEEPPAWERLPTTRVIAGPLGCAPRTWSRALIGSAPLGSGGLERARRRAVCAPWALGVEVGTGFAILGFPHSLSLQLTRRAEPSGMLVLAASEA